MAVIVSIRCVFGGGTASAADVPAVTERINEEIRRAWHAGNLQPASPADDATFLRRVSLHIGGSIPPVSVARTFLADESPDKRRRYVDALLEGPEYIAHFSKFWRHVMLPDPQNDFLQQRWGQSFEVWLQQQLAAGTAYDKVVRQILMPDASGNIRNEVDIAAIGSPLGFSIVRQSTPENMASGAMRVFLGVRAECAQCHDHPFDRWKQDQFWSVAAFFGPPLPDTGGTGRRLSIQIPGTERIVPAVYLDGSVPTAAQETEGGRVLLAKWMTSRENTQFAAATVNRLWGHFFGVGLVDEVDDFSDHNPPSHPELLAFLAEEFVQNDFDLKFMIRAITASEAYQLSSVRADPHQDDVRLYGRMRTQGLTAFQIRSSFQQATGLRGVQQIPGVVVQPGGNTGFFDQLFSEGTSTPLERETSILQALFLMNGPVVRQAIAGIRQQNSFGAIASNPFMSTDDCIDALYLSTLTRLPTNAERERAMQAFLEPNGANSSADLTSGLSDLFWVLLNCSEFHLNH